MEWTKGGKDHIARVPFFIRNRVKKRVEVEARQSGAKVVTLAHVQACQKKFLHQMEDEVKLPDGDVLWRQRLPKPGGIF